MAQPKTDSTPDPLQGWHPVKNLPRLPTSCYLLGKCWVKDSSGQIHLSDGPYSIPNAALVHELLPPQ